MDQAFRLADEPGDVTLQELQGLAKDSNDNDGNLLFARRRLLSGARVMTVPNGAESEVARGSFLRSRHGAAEQGEARSARGLGGARRTVKATSSGLF